MEVSEYLVGSPAFKAGGTGDPRTAGSIPVHLRWISPQDEIQLRWFLLVGLVFGLVGAMSPGAVGAQARLLDSSHADGDSIERIENVRFEFDGLLLADAATSVTLTRTNGVPVSVVDVSVDGTVLTARIIEDVPSGDYELAYVVRSADGGLNEDVLRLSIDSPSQSLSGGLLAVIGIFVALFAVMFVVFNTDRRRRRRRQFRE